MNSMSSADELLSLAIAHEVRNLLTPARGYVQLGSPEAAVRAIDRALAFAEAVLGGGEAVCDANEIVEGCGGVSRGTGLTVPIRGAVLEQVIENLALNARQAGGRPTVSCTSTPAGCQITVSDDGPGLPHHFRPAKGRGRGLMLCRFLVEQAGGTLRLDSEPGRGTTATIELPVAVQRQAA
jgi:signal transduction histidine kinase